MRVGPEPHGSSPTRISECQEVRSVIDFDEIVVVILIVVVIP